MRRFITVSIVGIMLLATVFAAASPAYADGLPPFEKFCRIIGGYWDADFKTCIADDPFCGPGLLPIAYSTYHGHPIFPCRPGSDGTELTYGGTADASTGNCGVYISNSTVDGTVKVQKLAIPYLDGIHNPSATGYKGIKEYVSLCQIAYFDADGERLPGYSSYAQVYFNLNSTTRNHYDNGNLLLMVWNGSGWEDCGATLVDAGEFGRLACGTSYNTFGLARQ